MSLPPPGVRVLQDVSTVPSPGFPSALADATPLAAGLLAIAEGALRRRSTDARSQISVWRAVIARFAMGRSQHGSPSLNPRHRAAEDSLSLVCTALRDRDAATSRGARLRAPALGDVLRSGTRSRFNSGDLPHPVSPKHVHFALTFQLRLSRTRSIQVGVRHRSKSHYAEAAWRVRCRCSRSRDMLILSCPTDVAYGLSSRS